MIFIGPMA